MPVIGGAAGYATMNPTQGNPIGDALAGVENTAFKYRAERLAEGRLEQDRKNSEQDVRDKKLKTTMDIADKFKIPRTSISSVNKATLDFSLDSQNMYSQQADILSASNDPEERRNAMEAMNNLKSNFDMAAALPEMLNASAKDLEEGVKSGKYNPRSSTNAAETIDALSNGNTKIIFKPNGIPTFITYKRDADGNLEDIIDSEMTLEQLKQKLTPIMAFDSATNDTEFKKTLGDKVKTEEGNNIREGYPNMAAAAEQNANSIVTNKDKMYGIASEVKMPDGSFIVPKVNLKDYSPEEIAAVKNHVKNGLELKYQDSITLNDAKLSREQTARNQARTQANSDRDFSLAQKKFNEEQLKTRGTKLDTTDVVFTKIGLAAQKAFKADPDNKGYTMAKEDYPQGSYIVRKTSKTVLPPEKKAAAKGKGKYAGIDPKTGKAIYK
jgi:hypothetical protein